MVFTKEELRKEYVDNEYSFIDCAKRLNVPLCRIKKYVVLWGIPVRVNNQPTKQSIRKLKNNPNLGSKTKEYYDKIVKTGIIPEEELIRRQKIGAWSKQFKRTKKHKAKIAKSLEGNNNSKGHIHSKETRALISKNSSKAIQEKISQEGFHWGMKCKTHSIESNRKNRESCIKYIEQTQFQGMPLKPRLGRTEKEILDQLEILFGYKILRQFKIAGYFIDGYIPEIRLVIEVDERHHKNQQDKDFQRQKEIEHLLNCKFLRIGE